MDGRRSRPSRAQESPAKAESQPQSQPQSQAQNTSAGGVGSASASEAGPKVQTETEGERREQGEEEADEEEEDEEEDDDDDQEDDDEDGGPYADEEDDDDEGFENFTTSEIVTVFVGPKRKRFFLHRDLICSRSPFMEKCLKKGRFEEGYNNELYLSEDHPKAFSILVDWIYRNKLPLRSDATFDLCDMSRAYCLADKFGMEELQNGIMDTIRASFGRNNNCEAHTTHAHAMSSSSVDVGKAPHFAAILLTHQKGPAKTPLKRFYVEHLVHHMMKHPKFYGEMRRSEPPRLDFERLADEPELVLYIFKKVWQFNTEPWKDPALWDKCCYHVHNPGGTVCAVKPPAPTPAGGLSYHHPHASAGNPRYHGRSTFRNSGFVGGGVGGLGPGGGMTLRNENGGGGTTTSSGGGGGGPAASGRGLIPPTMGPWTPSVGW